jgi:DNA-binding NtrC family response regulator
MQRLRLQIRRIGPHFRTMLVCGEPGSGKELTARALHHVSHAAEGPFIVCPADASQLTEAMRMAQSGTLFLDEISEMPAELQSRLLRMLRRQEWAQDGLGVPQKISLRMIASSSQDLRALVSAGRFQQELYHQMATLTISLPPLRERAEDIPELAMHFLRRFALAHSKTVNRIARDAMNQMIQFHWPGNVRELENVMHQGVLLNEGDVLEAQALPKFDEVAASPQRVASVGGSTRLQDIVEQHVLQVLKSCAGNKLRAAETLGISRSTLYRMLETTAEGNASGS